MTQTNTNTKYAKLQELNAQDVLQDSFDSLMHDHKELQDKHADLIEAYEELQDNFNKIFAYATGIIYFTGSILFLRDKVAK